MRAVLLQVSEAELAERRKRGLDRWDEMWEGVLHMAPAPAYEHQRIQDNVREVIVVDRDTKRPEVFRLAGRQYLALAADAEGGVVSESLGVRFRLVAGPPPRLEVADLAGPSARTEI